MPTASPGRRVAIVGGGLAGIAAAIRLVEAGYKPIVIESRKMLGGRATSIVDPRTGELIDNCQHVVLGCCTNLIDLYDRLDVLDKIQWHRTLYWTHANREIDRVRAAPLPAPFHLLPSFARMRLLSRAERREVRRVMWRIIRLGGPGRLTWSGLTFGEFLDHCKQSDSVTRKFWNVIITSACNLDVKRVGAAYAIQVFQEGFLANRWSYTMGLPTVPLVALYEPAKDLLRANGGEVCLGTSAKAIAFDGRGVTGVVTADGFIEAAAVVSAVPFDRLDKLVSNAMRTSDTRLQSLGRLEVSPILGVHLWFEHTIMDLPHLILADHDVQWLFNKGTDELGRQHIHAVISAADEWMGLTEGQIVERVVRDVHRALPRAVGMQPTQVRCIKERRATFAATPGSESYRPSAAPGYAGGEGIGNLFLAGDWCDTGWPATMEGAVRSGYAAAAALSSVGGVIEDIPPGYIARRLGLR
ncbi:MAG: hydroxysqualene dehydroxylase HpnE [Planctomycetota bacterium]|nr:hydroxysqualene dehydroxylase HpnE [Planctomycetota bacterium]MCZ6850664.1 hydroxysqualene dehydroxylase HpnE [Planctomycetota bacterium]